MMFRLLVTLGTVAVLLSPIGSRSVHAEDVVFTRLKITLFTDQDDKDDDEVVTIQIIRNSDGRVVGQEDYGQNETWDDQSQQYLEMNLKEAIPLKEKCGYKIKVSKSCAKGYPNGKGWHFCVREIDGIDSNGKAYEIRGKETDRILLGKHGSKTGPTNKTWDLCD